MAKGTTIHDAMILEYALHHLERERDEIQAKIDHIRRQLEGRLNGSAQSAESAPKRILSEEARQRIANAQKRRWAALRRAKAKAA